MILEQQFYLGKKKYIENEFIKILYL